MKGTQSIGTITALLAATACALAVAPAASAQRTRTLYAKTGPGFVISLRDASGDRVKRMRAGTYRIVVVDRTGDDAHNFRLRGPGVNRATAIGFVGRTMWTVALRRGLYRYVCDPHALAMHGSFRVY